MKVGNAEAKQSASHGAEFDHGEGLAVKAGALLAEEDGGTQFQTSVHDNLSDEWCKQDQQHTCCNNIEEALATAKIKSLL